jgi:hypothetical protein
MRDSAQTAMDMAELAAVRETPVAAMPEGIAAIVGRHAYTVFDAEAEPRRLR